VAAALVGAVAAARPAFAQPTNVPAAQPAPGTGAAPAQPPTIRPATTRPATVDVAGDLRTLSATLLGPDSSQASREEAAARLVSRGSPPADDILMSAITAADDPRVAVNRRLAIARALADDPVPTDAFIAPLADLMRFGAEQRAYTLTEAAAQALANYRRNSGALNQLVQFATSPQQPADARARVIRALGRVVEPEAADVLIRLLRNDRSALRTAASDALADLTGIRDYGADPARWAQWQRNTAPVAGLNVDRWRADLLDARTARLDRLRRRHESLVTALDKEFFERYQAAPRGERAALLLSALSSEEPDQRAMAAELVPTAFRNGDPVTDAMYERLIDMVGDSDPDVRENVAVTLRNLNHRPALGALLTQLSQERDERVKVALADALAPIEDPAAAPQLVALLNDPSPKVVAAAANAIAKTGRDLRRTDPAMARRAVTRLREIATARTPGSDALRSAALEALAAMQDPGLLELAQSLLVNQPDASVQVRQAALRALGALGNPAAADVIADALRAETREPTVRWAALDALGRVGRLAEHGNLLAEFMQQKTELDEDVRKKAWDVYQSMLPRASVEELNNEKNRFRNEPARLAAVLEEQCRKLEQRRGPQDAEVLASFRVALGETYMAHNPPLPELAVPHYRRALDHFFETRAADAVTIPLIEKLINAYLDTRNFTQATRFAEEMVGRDKAYRDVVGPPIKNLADKLRSKPETRAAALELMDAAIKMNPPLDERHLNDLRRFREEIQPAGADGN
jgi:HEAT repeat protein